MDEIPWGVEEERKGRERARLDALTVEAQRHLVCEQEEADAARRRARVETRRVLLEEAAELGFSDKEASARVDEAITAAGSTP